jgi:hypothetical protein
MMSKLRVGIAGGAIAVAAGLVLWSGSSQAGEDNKAVLDAVKKIADAIKSDDKDTAAKEAAKLSKKLENLEEAMNSFKPRSKGGIGVGPKKGDASKDGIELLLIDIGRDVPTAAQMKKEAAYIEEMAYQSAALSEIAKNWAPKKDKGQMTKKNWNKFNADMLDASLALAKAANKKGAQEVKSAAAKLNAACNSCHSVFRGK